MVDAMAPSPEEAFRIARRTASESGYELSGKYAECTRDGFVFMTSWKDVNLVVESK